MVEFIANLSDSDFISLLGAIGNWLAAIGTLLDVVVAIYLARNPVKIKLEAFAGDRVIIDQVAASRFEDKTMKCFVIHITNLSLRTVTIKMASFRIGRWWRKKQFAIMDNSLHLTDIEHGRFHQIITSYEEAPNWKEEFFDNFISEGPFNTLRLYIYTTVGSAHRVRLEKPFLDSLKQMVGEAKNQDET